MIQAGKKKESQRRKKILLYQWIHAHVWDLGEKTRFENSKNELIKLNSNKFNEIHF